MKTEITQRGFATGEFTDKNGKKCIVRESSLATEACIWLGIKDPRLTVFEDENMGKYLVTDLPKNWRVDSHMHLTRENVRELLPLLQNFVETGGYQMMIPVSYGIHYDRDTNERVTIEVTKFDPDTGLPVSWAIRKGGFRDVMSKVTGEFGYEPLPSDRDETFYEEYRFSDQEQAFDTWKKFHDKKKKDDQVL